MYAAIDIGSNAARLLIKRVENNGDGTTRFEKVFFFRFPLRLGDDVFAKGKLGKEKRRQLLTFIKACKQLMHLHGVEQYRACATSAMREAKNGVTVIKNIKKETSIKIEIIDGREEADIIYGNHIELATQQMKSCAYVDVGGGSTEVTIIKNGRIMSSKSYNIGTLRMLHQSKEEVEEEMNMMRTELREYALNNGPLNIVGSGGNINKIYKLVSEKKKKDEHVSPSALSQLLETLKPLSLEQRMEQFGLKADRADVIVPAAEIFLLVAESLRCRYIFVPTLGLADGIIDRIYVADKDPLNREVKNAQALTSDDNLESDDESEPEIDEDLVPDGDDSPQDGDRT